MLSILSASASALATPPDASFQLTTRQMPAGNTPSAPGFMTGSNVTISTWTRAGCGDNSDGTENIFFPDVLYGKNNHALVVSYMLGRDLETNEELDMSFAYADGHTVNGIDPECALFQFKVSPSNVGPLSGKTCYTPTAPVTCFNLWRTS